MSANFFMRCVWDVLSFLLRNHSICFWRRCSWDGFHSILTDKTHTGVPFIPVEFLDLLFLIHFLSSSSLIILIIIWHFSLSIFPASLHDPLGIQSNGSSWFTRNFSRVIVIVFIPPLSCYKEHTCNYFLYSFSLSCISRINIYRQRERPHKREQNQSYRTCRFASSPALSLQFVTLPFNSPFLSEKRVVIKVTRKWSM